ncbi:MAG TPA: dihydrolipoamide acetyltransferase family protein [Dehalococcoidia bacterium]|nr:dihydrolipoamide acetyltransferase family protein [Dehalococcoidia bacterium]
MSDFRLPELGEDIEEADVLKVLVSEGDVVEAGQPVLEIETEKATLEVPAEAAGTVTKIHVAQGQTIKVGQVIATIEAGAAAAEAPSEPEQPAEAPPETAKEQASPEPAPAAEPPAAVPSSGAPVPDATPTTSPERAETDTVPPPPPPPPSGEAPAFASPSIRKLAREIGVDIATVSGSGPGGRITDEDVKRASRERKPAPTSVQPSTDRQRPGSEFRQLPDFSQWGPINREPVSRLRRTVARNMAQSWSEIPHVHLQYHADITAMEDMRQQFKERANEAGGNLTISVMMVKVVAAALRAHPRVNASYDHDTQELILKDYVHIGVAVDTDRGLVVPKIENVDEKNIIELSVELNGIAERARNNDLTLEEMRGSTFTVTNLGSLGTGYFSPIINWPEVAVLGLGRAQRTAVWDEKAKDFTPRLIMPLSFGHDHRVLDGADGARFMSWIVEAIRNPMLMALEG